MYKEQDKSINAYQTCSSFTALHACFADDKDDWKRRHKVSAHPDMRTRLQEGMVDSAQRNLEKDDELLEL